jgi:hypothetical protein
MKPALKDVIERAEEWPQEDQDELVRAAQLIEQRRKGEDWAIIDARLDAARRGDIASDEEVKVVFSKYRQS